MDAKRDGQSSSYRKKKQQTKKSCSRDYKWKIMNILADSCVRDLANIGMSKNRSCVAGTWKERKSLFSKFRKALSMKIQLQYRDNTDCKGLTKIYWRRQLNIIVFGVYYTTEIYQTNQKLNIKKNCLGNIFFGG